MKYNAPPGGSADAPFLDGNRSAGIRGSIVPAAAVEADQRELVHLIEHSGQTPNEEDLQQVRKAIAAMISAATGGGDTSQYLLMSQARARLPFFPEILSADGRMNVSSPATGTILVPAAVSFQHRGIFPVSTSSYSEGARTFTTVANKTYHLRWDQTNGFRLRDVVDATYNPTLLAETNPIFDSSFDDMLIARVVTNSGNVAAVTNLMNKDRSGFRQYTGRLTDVFVDNNIYGTNGVRRNNNLFQYDWARTPLMSSIDVVMGAAEPSPTGTGIHGAANAVFNKIINRYSTVFDVATDFINASAGGYVEIDFQASL